MEEDEPNIEDMEKKWKLLKNKDPNKEKREFMDSRQREETKKEGEKKDQTKETEARQKKSESGDKTD